MSKRRTLCDWSKERIKKKADDLLNIVDRPTFACRKCARVANHAIHLCKPMPLPRRNKLSDVG